MRIHSCNLENFRNIEQARLRFETDRIFFVGLNGQGKSNLLEALALLHAVRSFRTADLRHLINKKSAMSRAYFELETAAPDRETVLLSIKRASGREVELNGEKCSSLRDYLARFPSVVLATDDVQIIRGSPSLRRRMLDLHFSSSRPGYYNLLRDFTRGLAARNRLLKERAAPEQIRAHDQPLSKAAMHLIEERKQGTVQLSEGFTRLFERISGGLDGPGLRLQRSAKTNTAEELCASWEEGFDRDRLLGATQIGPHRDDWIFSTSVGDARNFASDGQQRNLAIALKLALFHDLSERLSEKPILLADDILGELDEKRRAAFWESVPEGCQIFSTGTRFEGSANPGDWQVFQVENGVFTPRN